MSKDKLRYTEMCIYVDENIYNSTYDEEKIFDYIWKIYYALAAKRRLITNKKDICDYVLYCTTHTFLRLTDRRQYLEERDPKHLPTIKSISNYAESMLYPLRAKFYLDKKSEQCFVGATQVDTANTATELIRGVRADNKDGLLNAEIDSYIVAICRIIKNFVKKTPYGKDKVTFKNLYISCLLTMLRGVTLSNAHQRTLDNSPRVNNLIWIENTFKQETLTAPIVWKLPNEMVDYVAVLVEQIKRVVVEDINYLLKVYAPQEEILETVLLMNTIEEGDCE